MRITTVFSIVKANIKIWYLKAINKEKNILPYKVLINLTDLCNSRCVYCEIWKIKPVNEINLTHIKKIFNDLNKNLLWLSLSGGEVTLVRYYKELIDEVLISCPNLKILAFTTNALAVNKAVDFAKYARDKGLDVLVTISLDGDEETHDKLRGIPGNYKKCQALYDQLLEEKINVNFGITVSDQNSSFIQEKYLDYKDKIKAVTFVHDEGIYNVKSKTNDKKILDSMKLIYKNYNLKKLHEFVEKIHIKIAILFLEKQRKKNIIPCEVLTTSAHVMPNGDIKPCMFMDKIGNIKNENFKDVYLSKKTDDVRKEIKNNNCPKCWMNCYSPHSIMQNPFKALLSFFK